MNKKLKIIDLFAGCGGLSDGFDATGLYETVACVEWELQPCLTLRNRLKSKWGYSNTDDIVMQFDIQRTSELINGWNNDPVFGSSEGLNKKITKAGGVDVIIGGPPCQAYSIAGRVRDENGMNDDYRNFLFESYLEIARKFRPKVLVFENVPGILSAKPGGISIIKRITKAFAAIGYDIITDLKNYALIDCTKYGVPQARKRVIIVGVNRDLVNTTPQEALEAFYKKIFPTFQAKNKTTVRDAIADLPELIPLKNPIRISRKKYTHSYYQDGIPNHEPRCHSPRDIKTFRMLANDIETGEFKYISIESLKNLYYTLTGRNSNIHKYYVLRWDRQSNTIPAHLYKDGLRHIHPDSKQARSITVREAARLQTFDDDFIFLGSMTDQYKMIGNAVPPRFAKAIGQAIEVFIKKFFK